MKGLLIVLLSLSVLADESYYHFRHGCIMHKRMIKVQKNTKILEDRLEKIKQVERRIMHELDLNYEDTKMATKRKDKILLQKTIDTLQKQLRKARQTKLEILRALRKQADSLTGVERGRIIRKNRLEQYVDYHGTNIAKEYQTANHKVYQLEEKYALETAKKAAKIAANIIFAKEKSLPKDKQRDQTKLKKYIKKHAKKAYLKAFRIVQRFIEKETLRGLSIKRVEENVKIHTEELLNEMKVGEKMLLHQIKITEKLEGKAEKKAEKKEEQKSN
ncbi:hypothetical protein EIN_081670 [Entamoeba invadens IP1]|uniref:Uncharacterized protein n=1 Tax=Entamoeba invadens TaxID=33085 RepID=S0B575_ENTIV|nr:hypothetical protein EIN_081670 [Entamoeba invadens IP1]BAN40661.1 hypothetical protein [Entamoeba invadens]ELP85135.1 hypothetical protein EIN_081670 [Entamoeba invadens IP1]BAN41476.1 hypothetical protein [Entamoeba invadens]BAN42300.1 hypothetical protein [Entamoeba invadens]BAN42359.1 hypothetical protein [Entamoeba invadens]|eukprot:XP_004184481.1 hypothetical protein EIN_081670 [Entamoeba invadens IP1]